MKNFHDRKQPLDSRQLLAFVTLADTRNFTLAGRELFLSQSAVSHALKALEGDVGCRLVDRLGKKIQLTAAGEDFLHHARKVLGGMTAARDSLDRLAKWGKGRLRVAASESIRQHLLPEVLLGFQKDYADWPVTVESADTRESIELLQQGNIDCAIAIAPSRSEAVDLVPLFTDEIGWVVPPHHPWARTGRAAPEEISAQRLILHHSGSYTCRLLEKYFQQASMELKVYLELGSLEAIKTAVKRGLGIAVLAPWVMRPELQDQSLIHLPLGKRKLRRNWCALRSLDQKPTLAGETFVRHFQNTVKALPDLQPMS
ncbi:MAG TPA: LysR family transcriptional regulator [Dongiaceae bacterium]|nr:LysR family transcriptional regulator [Dongiaceae bacterium]